MSDNWIVQNLTNALNTWNSKLSEIWSLVTQSPESFKGGGVWSVIRSIHGSLVAVDGLNTVLPYGVRMIDALRTMTTESTAVLMPFKTQELFDGGGICYGHNAISKNLIVINRKHLLNGNGFVFGVSGSGKGRARKGAEPADAPDGRSESGGCRPMSESRHNGTGVRTKPLDIRDRAMAAADVTSDAAKLGAEKARFAQRRAEVPPDETKPEGDAVSAVEETKQQLAGDIERAAHAAFRQAASRKEREAAPLEKDAGTEAAKTDEPPYGDDVHDNHCQDNNTSKKGNCSVHPE